MIDPNEDPIMKVKNIQELESFLYGEKIDEFLYQASKGNRRTKAQVIGELGEREFDNLPDYDACAERGAQYE